MTWSACDRALVRVNFYSKEIGWEQFEEILLFVRKEIENFRCCRIRRSPETRIRPRVMNLWKRLRLEISRLGDRNPKLTRDFFQKLELDITGCLLMALTRNQHSADGFPF